MSVFIQFLSVLPIVAEGAVDILNIVFLLEVLSVKILVLKVLGVINTKPWLSQFGIYLV